MQEYAMFSSRITNMRVFKMITLIFDDARIEGRTCFNHKRATSLLAPNRLRLDLDSFVELVLANISQNLSCSPAPVTIE